jgi:hypothetical protein
MKNLLWFVDGWIWLLPSAVLIVDGELRSGSGRS